MNITKARYSDISETQTSENKKVQYNKQRETETDRYNTNTIEPDRYEKDEYKMSSEYQNRSKVILSNSDGVVIRNETEESLRKKEIQRSAYSNMDNNDTEINLSDYTKKQVEDLYDSGQITRTQYELEMKKRGIEDSSKITEDKNEEKVNTEDENPTESKIEKKDKTNVEVKQPFEELMQQNYSFDEVINSAKQLIKESNRFDKEINI